MPASAGGADARFFHNRPQVAANECRLHAGGKWKPSETYDKFWRRNALTLA